MGRARGVSRAYVSQDVRRRKAESRPANPNRVHNRRSVIAPRGLVTAPHGLAATSGLKILQEGGNAVEAAIAAAATIAVVYPHMNAIGGDHLRLRYAGCTRRRLELRSWRGCCARRYPRCLR